VITAQQADLAAALRRHARRHPEKTAMIEAVNGGRWREVSYAEFDRMADRYAHGFAAKGMRPGDKIVFLAKPSVDSLAALYGLVRLRAVPVAIDPGMGFGELLRCIGEIAPDGFLGVPMLQLVRRIFPKPFRTARLFITDGPRALGATCTLASCVAETEHPYPTPDVELSQKGYVFFTSGSTGTAKPVSISYSNLWHRLRLVAGVCDWDENAKVVACFPSYAPAVLSVGGTAILPAMDFAKPGAAPSDKIADAICTFEANGMLAAPVVWMNLVRHCERSGESLPTVRDGITAGAPIPVNLHRRLAAVIHPQGTLHTPYGATEALPLTSVTSETLIETWPETLRGGGVCVGPVLPEMRVEIVRITDEPIPYWSDSLRVPDGSVGEIVAAGPTISQAYVRLDRANALAKIRDGGTVLHRMGDLGRIDAEGRLWFCGRKSDRIETDDALLLPVCGEAMLAENPDVFQAALIRVEDDPRRPVVASLRLEPGRRLDGALVAKLETLVEDTDWAGRIDLYLQCTKIPTDTRHNSKIRREDLTQQVRPKLRRGIAPPRR
jgi:acyl-CoA synthetase (AMP-forming)/AMP-acid ligase II